MVPVLTGFAERHHVDDVVVVADAGMLSAANLVALEEAGFAFIVGSRPSSAVDDLASVSSLLCKAGGFGHRWGLIRSG